MRLSIVLLALLLCLASSCTRQTKGDQPPLDEVIGEAPPEDSGVFTEGEPAPYELYAYGATKHHLTRFLLRADAKKESGYILSERAPLQKQWKLFKGEDVGSIQKQLLSDMLCIEHENQQLCTNAPSLPLGQPKLLDAGNDEPVNFDIERASMGKLLELFTTILGHPIQADIESAEGVLVTVATYNISARLLLSQLLWLTEARVEEREDALAVSYTPDKASPNAARGDVQPRVFEACGDRIEGATALTCTSRDELSLIAVMVTPGVGEDAPPLHRAMITCRDTYGVVQRAGSVELSLGEGCLASERINFRVSEVSTDRVVFIALEDENRRFELRPKR